MASDSVLVVGVGNVLLGDDAIGPTVVAHLQAGYDFPETVELLDLGTPGLNLQPYLRGRRAVVLIDAVKSDHPPGSLVRLGREELLRRPPPPRVSPHDLALKESLALTELTEGRALPIQFIGVSVARTEQGEPMTADVEAAVQPAIESVLGALRTLDISPVAKSNARPPHLWWTN